MARIRGNITAVCLNEDCVFYQKERGKNVVKRGFNRAGTQRYICLHCNKYLVETKGTMMYRRRIGERNLKKLCDLLIKQNGIRSMSRMLEINKNTVGDWLNNMAGHSVQITDFLIKNLELPAHEVNEFWMNLNKHKKNLSPKFRREISKMMRECRLAMKTGSIIHR